MGGKTVVNVSLNEVRQNAAGIPGRASGSGGGVTGILTAAQIRDIALVYSSTEVDSLLTAYLTTSAATTLLAAKADLVGGVVPTTELGSGSGGAGSKYLADDSTWKTIDFSPYITSATAAATYLPLTGGTLTGDLKFTDATYDIGKSGATRPRDGFFSRDLTTTGNLSASKLVCAPNNGDAALTVGGVSDTGIFNYGSRYLSISGAIVISAPSVTPRLLLRSDCGLHWNSNTNLESPSIDLSLYRGEANILEQRNSTNAQTFRLSGTWTSTSSLELLQMRGVASSSFEIGTMNGSAGGTLRGLTIGCYPAGASTIVGWAQFRPNTSTGALEAFYLGPIADGTVTGGNARGVGSIDLQVIRGAANQVASGPNAILLGGSSNRVANGYGYAAIVAGNNNTVTGANAVVVVGNACTASGVFSTVVNGNTNTASAEGAFIGAGSYNTASGTYSFIGGGELNTASAIYSVVTGGGRAVANRYGMRAFACGAFAAGGDAQSVGFILRRKTTDATPTNLGLDGSTTRLTISSGKTMSGFLIVKGVKSDGSAKARFVRLCDITNVGGTTTMDVAAEAIGTDLNPSACTLAVTAENATDDLQVNITAPAGETWRWVATFSGLEIAYGT